MKKIKFVSIIFFIITFLGWFNCKKKSLYIEKTDIARLTNQENISIQIRKKFNVYGSSLVENVILFQSNENFYLGIFTDKKSNNKNYELIQKIELSKEYKTKKIMFINPAIDYSHIVLLQQNKQDKKYSLYLLSTNGLKQRIQLKKNTLKKVYIEKNKKAPYDEMIFIEDSIYRFDSMQYIETFYDSPFPFIKKIKIDNENSYVKIINRGFYAPRSYITLSFPDLSAKNFHEYVKFVQKIPTVRLYAPGKFVYKKTKTGKTRGVTKYYMIEITKSPFLNRYSVNLPIFFKKGLGRILLRISYSYQGNMINWPLDSQEAEFIKKDQQNYKAYVIQKEIFY